MDALALPTSAADMAGVFAQGEEAVRLAFALLREADERINEVFALGGDCGGRIYIETSACHHTPDFKDVDVTIDRMARKAWSRIVEKMELRRFMSIKGRKIIDEQLEKGELPKITEANIRAFFNGWVANMGAMLEEAIAEVFEFLRPHASEHKTNTELEIGRKVILAGWVKGASFGRGFAVTSYHSQHLTALENVFNTLDGHGSINKVYRSRLEDAIEASETRAGQTDLFAFKLYRNGNLHLEFLRTDLLKKLNMRAGGKNLRPARAD